MQYFMPTDSASAATNLNLNEMKVAEPSKQTFFQDPISVSVLRHFTLFGAYPKVLLTANPIDFL